MFIELSDYVFETFLRLSPRNGIQKYLISSRFLSNRPPVRRKFSFSVVSNRNMLSLQMHDKHIRRQKENNNKHKRLHVYTTRVHVGIIRKNVICFYFLLSCISFQPIAIYLEFWDVTKDCAAQTTKTNFRLKHSSTFSKTLPVYTIKYSAHIKHKQPENNQ